MSKMIIFIQEHGKAGIREAEVTEAATVRDLESALKALGIETGEGSLVFIDDAEEALDRESDKPVDGLKHGTRIHISRCRRINLAVHFMDRTIEREFAPGARVRAVKEWAVRAFKMSPKDAAEHVLQICKTTKRPATDTPLQELVDGKHCALCFDLVPEKRVEG